MKTILSVLSLIALTSSAFASQDTEEEVLSLLQRILSVGKDKRGYCQDNANTVECNGGRCGGGENPNNWDKGNYYCYRCPGTTGGFQCELPDPCTPNPCPTTNPKKTECKPSSFFADGYYCKKPRKVTTRDQLLEDLDLHADRSDINEIRELILLTEDVDDAVVEGMKRQVKREC